VELERGFTIMTFLTRLAHKSSLWKLTPLPRSTFLNDFIYVRNLLFISYLYLLLQRLASPGGEQANVFSPSPALLVVSAAGLPIASVC
jgi:hypothetical protein